MWVIIRWQVIVKPIVDILASSKYLLEIKNELKLHIDSNINIYISARYSEQTCPIDQMEYFLRSLKKYAAIIF